MKEKYMKPLMSLELFSLTQTVAGTCTANIPKDQFNSNDPYGCQMLWGDMNVFMPNTGCMLDGNLFDGFCYNNPTEDQIVFRS